MNSFDTKLSECGRYPLTAESVSTLQVNMGYRCNLRCAHCHVEASPARKETMSLSVLSRILDVLHDHYEIRTVDITGGSPELNPYYKYFVKSCRSIGRDVWVRTNLAIYSETGMESIPQFLAQNGVKIIASLPCYTEQGVDSQRGNGTYQKAIRALKQLNALGYGVEGSGLLLDIMFNPARAEIAPDQKMLEAAYREQLGSMHGITFNHLIALSNMPIGRLGKSLSEEALQKYIHTLREQFNPATVDHVMCRHLLSISPDGTLYDCDFWQMLKLPVNNGHAHINDFDYAALSTRKIVTNALCLMCTAGAGASCSGALT